MSCCLLMASYARRLWPSEQRPKQFQSCLSRWRVIRIFFSEPARRSHPASPPEPCRPLSPRDGKGPPRRAYGMLPRRASYAGEPPALPRSSGVKASSREVMSVAINTPEEHCASGQSLVSDKYHKFPTSPFQMGQAVTNLELEEPEIAVKSEVGKHKESGEWSSCGPQRSSHEHRGCGRSPW